MCTISQIFLPNRLSQVGAVFYFSRKMSKVIFAGQRMNVNSSIEGNVTYLTVGPISSIVGPVLSTLVMKGDRMLGSIRGALGRG